jgi:hypothetical protein
MSLNAGETIIESADDRRVESRGVVLIASASSAFADAVGALVRECEFTPTFPTGMEAPWLSVTRTQPRLVICDWDDRVFVA